MKIPRRWMMGCAVPVMTLLLGGCDMFTVEDRVPHDTSLPTAVESRPIAAEQNKEVATDLMAAVAEVAISRFKRHFSAFPNALVVSVHVETRETLSCFIDCPPLSPSHSSMTRQLASVMGSDRESIGPHIQLKLLVPGSEPSVQNVVVILSTHHMSLEVIEQYNISVTNTDGRFTARIMVEIVAHAHDGFLAEYNGLNKGVQVTGGSEGWPYGGGVAVA